MLFDRSSAEWRSDPGKAIRSADELLSVLHACAQGKPRVFELDAPEGAHLQLGLGGAYACAQFVTADDPPFSFDAETRSVTASDDVEFLLGGTPTPIAPEFCLSFAEALEVAEYFFETGQRDPTIVWRPSG